MSNFSPPPITGVILILTNQCCLRCKYCFESHFDEHMSFEVARDTVDFVMKNCNLPEAKNKTPSFTFFGGEPLMCYDDIIVPLTNYIRNTYGNTPLLSMTTNGILLDESKLSFLKDNQCSIMLSLDGARRSQDINRVLKSGKSSFDILETKLPLIMSIYPNCNFRMTLTKETLPFLFENIMFLESIGAKKLKIEPNLYEQWDDSDMAIFEGQMQLYEEYIYQKFVDHQTPLVFKELSNVFLDMIRIDSSNEANVYRACYGCAASEHCGIGCRGSATVEYDGSLYSCHRVDMKHDSPFYIGNIYDGVDDLRVESLRNGVDEAINASMHSPKCDGCLRNCICDGGCAPVNYAITNNFSVPSSTYCYWNRTLLDIAVSLSRRLSDVKSEEFKAFFQSSVSSRR